MKKLIFIFLFLISFPVFAEQYAVELDDGSIGILNYNPGSEDTLEEALKAFGETPKPYHKVSGVNWSDIDHLKWDNGLVVDEVKKQEALDAKQARIDAKEAVLLKLGITEKELKDLLS